MFPSWLHQLFGYFAFVFFTWLCDLGGVLLVCSWYNFGGYIKKVFYMYVSWLYVWCCGIFFSHCEVVVCLEVLFALIFVCVLWF